MFWFWIGYALMAQFAFGRGVATNTPKNFLEFCVAVFFAIFFWPVILGMSVGSYNKI